MKGINEVISKIVSDEEFSNVFFNDPMKAVEGFELTDEEKAQLANINIQELLELSNELEDRLSKSFINLPNFTDDDGEGAGHSSTHVNHSSEAHASAAW